MALTLVEMANSYQSMDPMRMAYINMYAMGSDILRVLPFDDITGGAIKFSQQHTLPGIGVRGVNEAFEESTGKQTTVLEGLIYAGGDLDIDKALVRNFGTGRRASEEETKLNALSLAWSKMFIKGNSAEDPRVFNGLQTRVVGDYLIPAGSTTGGDPLKLSILDEAIDACSNPTHICMNKAMRRRFSQAIRNASISGNIQTMKDEFGRPVFVYNDLPILLFDKDNENNLILDFNEVCPSGATNTGTSIYILSVGTSSLAGIQASEPKITDLGELQDKPSYRTRVEWDNSIVLYRPDAAVRIYGISNAAIAA